MKRFSLTLLVLASLAYGLGSAFGADPAPCPAHDQAAKATDAATSEAPKGPSAGDCKNCPHMAASKECPCGKECQCAKDKAGCKCGEGCQCAKADCRCGKDCRCATDAKDCKCGEGCGCRKKL